MAVDFTKYQVSTGSAAPVATPFSQYAATTTAAPTLSQIFPSPASSSVDLQTQTTDPTIWRKLGQRFSNIKDTWTEEKTNTGILSYIANNPIIETLSQLGGATIDIGDAVVRDMIEKTKLPEDSRIAEINRNIRAPMTEEDELYSGAAKHDAAIRNYFDTMIGGAQYGLEVSQEQYPNATKIAEQGFNIFGGLYPTVRGTIMLKNEIAPALTRTEMADGSVVFRNPETNKPVYVTDSEGVVISGEKPLVPAVSDWMATREVQSQADEIADVLRKNKSKANDAILTRPGADEAFTRIARSNVLKGSVDESGQIKTMEPGMAYDAYKAATIDGMEDVVRNLLRREGASVSLVQVKNALLEAVESLRLEGKALINARNAVEKEIRGLTERANNLGEVPLETIHNAKIVMNDGAYRGALTAGKLRDRRLGMAYKKVIENSSKEAIKPINRELSKYLGDLEIIRALDGKRVKGGRLGKYTAQLGGNIAGAAVGGVVGGPVGAGAASLLGGKVASTIQGKLLSNTLGGRFQGKIPRSNTLEAAKARAGLPKEVDLKVPDKRIGAPSGVPRTKEISLIERRISENVSAQKAAIKAKNWEVVAVLKRVYLTLVEKLENLVSEIKESAKNPSIGLSIRKSVTPESVAKKIDREDYLDFARLVDDPSLAKTDTKLARLVNNVGLTRATNAEIERFAKEVLDEYDGVASREVI